MKKWIKWTIFVVVCVLLLGSGVFCGYKWYDDAHRESYIRGSINLGNQFYSQQFKFVLDDLVLTPNTENTEYTYTQENLPAVPFDAANNEYQFKFNDRNIYAVNYTAGTVAVDIPISFYDTDNQLISQPTLQIRIAFYKKRTKMTISTNSLNGCKYLNQFFINNNCRILIKEIAGGNNE